jgi:NADH:ubiquinone oxidoreductase subunit 2 (subunit N)
MIIYGITTINIFTILIMLSEFKGRDLKMIKDLSGILKLNPLLSIAFALNLFSLAGVCLLSYLRNTNILLSIQVNSS